MLKKLFIIIFIQYNENFELQVSGLEQFLSKLIFIEGFHPKIQIVGHAKFTTSFLANCF
jgi:hypothetical protein